MTKVIEQKQNPLFGRKEITLEVESNATPSHIEAKNFVCEEFKCKDKVVRINKISSRFGAKVFTIQADIYDSEEEYKQVVKKTKQEVEAEKKAEEERIQAEKDAKAAVAEEKTE